jgi:hypothetical protein
MLETMPPEAVELDDRALIVRYRTDPGRPDLVRVTITAHHTQGDPENVKSSELVLVAVAERMTREAMHARVRAEAARRAAARVAWIEEF